MINLKHVTLRNFLSVGSVTQAVDLNNQELTLILGDNLDLGGDGARNGTGKTTLIQAVSYALYGVPLNSIKANNLINRTNGKSMMVTLDFEANGVDYRIERGRKPHGMKFFIKLKGLATMNCFLVVLSSTDTCLSYYEKRYLLCFRLSCEGRLDIEVIIVSG